ncbi:MAG: outer membrane protein assembly factor BamD [Fibromonadaceae bacterium]|jgi:outer membrane protein assembly factor BamD (BamD/ComL family)|nr:outer membrane protein assembly factor BamD [Fibromonadaceae bacterium]
MAKILRIGILFIALFILVQTTGCTCCAYFNHAWNMEQAYEEAGVLREARLDSLPGDSILEAGEEKRLYDRVIEKGSRTVERFPKNENQVPKAVFMMAEAFRHKSEWKKAIEKYDELERYFPQYDSIPKAEYERAFCLYKNTEYALAKFSAERVLEKGKQHPYHLQALELMSILQEKDGLPSDAIASLEAVLATNFGTPWTRAKARIRLADLYYEQKIYSKAREHYLHKELSILPDLERYKAQSTAIECLLMLSEANAKEAAKEYKNLADSAVFKDKRTLSLIRQGEILLSINDEKGIEILRDAAHVRRRSETASRAFFGIGDFRQRTRNYSNAILHYDSSYQSKSASKWGNESYIRRVALLRLLALKDTVVERQKKEKPFFPQEFQIAELFLLKLSETDSALALLAKLDSVLTDSVLKVRATYTRAFIYDEFKKDTANAYPLYRAIIEKYPQTDYAKQAQANMGLQVSAKTREDLAHEAFLKAEETLVNAKKIPQEKIEETDIAYKTAISLYDSVTIKFPETQFALQAMYVKAYILAEEIGNLDSARVILSKLSKEHFRSPWGRSASEKLRGKLAIDANDIERLRNRVKEFEVSIKEQSENYYIESERKKNEPPPPPKPVDDEVLLNDYNTLYDFK